MRGHARKSAGGDACRARAIASGASWSIPSCGSRIVRDVFAAGDIASSVVDGQHPTVMSCQFARPMGRFAGHNVVADLVGQPLLPLRIDWYVTVLDLGGWGALYTEGWDREVRTTGAAAEGDQADHQPQAASIRRSPAARKSCSRRPRRPCSRRRRRMERSRRDRAYIRGVIVRLVEPRWTIQYSRGRRD